MPRSRSARSAGGVAPVTADDVKRVAIELFGDRGYPVIGMRDLSEAVGILPGSLYAHIVSKEALLLDIVESGIANFVEVIAPIVESEGPADVRLRQAIRGHVRVLSGTLQQTRIAFHQWNYLTGDNRTRVLGVRQTYEDLFTRLLREGVAEGTLRPAAGRKTSALTIIGALGWATEWYQPGGTRTPEQVGDAIADVVLVGLADGDPTP